MARWFEATKSQNPDQISFLVLIGPPMSVNNEAAFPWPALEKCFISNVIAAAKPLSSIYLGAYLTAPAWVPGFDPNAVEEIE